MSGRSARSTTLGRMVQDAVFPDQVTAHKPRRRPVPVAKRVVDTLFERARLAEHLDRVWPDIDPAHSL
jgi:hypothetical protein